MKLFCSLALVAVCFALLSPELAAGQRIYTRHRRSVDADGKPEKESTVVIASDNSSEHSAAADLPDDLKPHVEKNDKDCNDVFEMDYNPRRDVFMFNGRLPNPFGSSDPQFGNDSEPESDAPQHHHHHHHRQAMINMHDMFQQMFRQASQMFNRFPAMNDTPMINQNFPENYNGTTEEIVTLNGHKLLKKQHIVNKNVDGVQVHLISTTYEDIKDETNTTEGSKTDVPTSPTDNGTSLKPEIEKEGTPITKGEDITKKPDDLTDGTVVQY